MRILLIEDEPEIAKFIERGLERAKYAVDTVDDGKLGLFQAAVNKYDIILCDYMLPLKNGLEVTHALREKGVKTPLLMLTVVDDLDTKVKALDAGADDYICKPFAFDELLARIRALLRRESTWQGDKLVISDLSLDTKEHTVTRASKPIKLTRKEFMLLEYLLRHPESVVSRNQLLEHVWDSAADPLTNSIEVHIRYLRKKIDEPWGRNRRLIHTIHGVGYKISSDPPPRYKPYPALG